MKKLLCSSLLGVSLAVAAQASPQSDFSQALEAIQQENYPLAHQLLKSIVSNNPNAVTAKFYLAQTAQQMEQWEDAARLYHEILDQHPDHPQAQLGLGICSYYIEDYKNARINLKQVVAGQPQNATAYYYLGLIEGKTGNKQLAIKHLNTSKSIDPKYTQIALAAMVEEYPQHSSNGQELATISHPLIDEWKPRNLEVNLWVGMEYDDNLTVVEADRQSDESDQAMTVDMDISYQLGQWQSWDWSTGYDIYQSHYQDLDEFDLSAQSLWLTAERTLGDYDIRGHYRYNHTRIDSDKLYSSHSLQPAISRQLNSQIYATLFSDLESRDFEDDRRDGTLTRLGSDIIWFPDSSQSYGVFSVALTNDNTDGDEYIYQGLNLSGAWYFPVQFQNLTFKNAISLRWEDRDYKNDTPSIGKARNDDRISIKLSTEYRIRKNWNIKASYEYVDNDSNLDSLAYHQNLFSLTTGLSF